MTVTPLAAGKPASSKVHAPAASLAPYYTFCMSAEYPDGDPKRSASSSPPPAGYCSRLMDASGVCLSIILCSLLFSCIVTICVPYIGSSQVVSVRFLLPGIRKGSFRDRSARRVERFTKLKEEGRLWLPRIRTNSTRRVGIELAMMVTLSSTAAMMIMT